MDWQTGLDKESTHSCLVLECVEVLQTFDKTIRDLLVSLFHRETKQINIILKEKFIRYGQSFSVKHLFHLFP